MNEKKSSSLAAICCLLCCAVGLRSCIIAPCTTRRAKHVLETLETLEWICSDTASPSLPPHKPSREICGVLDAPGLSRQLALEHPGGCAGWERSCWRIRGDINRLQRWRKRWPGFSRCRSSLSVSRAPGRAPGALGSPGPICSAGMP